MQKAQTIPYQRIMDASSLQLIRFSGFFDAASLEPHRHGFYMLQLVTGGMGSHRIDFREHPTVPGQISFLHEHQVHQVLQYPDDGWMVLFDQGVFDRLCRANPQLDGVGLLDAFSATTPVYAGDELAILEQLFALLQQEITRGEPLVLLEKYLAILLHHANRCYRRDEGGSDALSQEVQLVRRLKKLIGEHFRSQRETIFYARHLGTSSRKLNELCERTTGRLVAQLITDRLLCEAEALLAVTDLAVKEIAFSLSFNDSAHFGKFFRKHKGISPIRFRDQQGRTT